MLAKKLAEMIRVNHAGEYGAKYIYKGQIKAFDIKKDHESKKLVEEMKKHEDVHFDYFDEKISSQEVRPTLISPLWKLGGYAMGFVTAMLDKKAAMTCTTAVEEVIDSHYQEQIDYIANEKKFITDKAKKDSIEMLEKKIVEFQEDEIHHRDIGYENNADQYKFFNPLTVVIKTITKSAIKISKKI